MQENDPLGVFRGVFSCAFPLRIMFLFPHKRLSLCYRLGKAVPWHMAITFSSSCAPSCLSLPGSGDCGRRRPHPATSWSCWCCRDCWVDGVDVSWCRSSDNLMLSDRSCLLAVVKVLPQSVINREKCIVHLPNTCCTYDSCRIFWGYPIARSHDNGLLERVAEWSPSDTGTSQASWSRIAHASGQTCGHSAPQGAGYRPLRKQERQ